MEQTNLNLIPQKDKPVINASQYDNGRVVRFNLFDGEDEYTLAGTETAVCNIRKVDGHVVVITPSVVADKTYIDVTLTEQANACFGDQIGELVITSGDVVIGTCNFILRVEKSPMTGGVTSASDIDNLTTQITNIVVQVIGEDYYTKEQVDEIIESIPTFDPENYYDKSAVNDLLDQKADRSDLPDMSDYYTKSETDTALGLKANAADVYTKGETDTLLSAKANASNVYTKSEVDYSLSFKITGPLVFTPSGFPVDFYTVNNAADKCPLPVLKVNVTSGDKIAKLVSYQGSNIFGGLPFAKCFSACSDYALNTVNKTVQFTHAAGITEDTMAFILKMPFKANTQYTFIANYEAAARNTSIRFFYTDNTNSYFDFTATTEKTAFRIVSTANKTIKYIAVGYWGAGLTTLYYDECGIFEGDVPATDFESFVGNVATVDFNVTLDQSGVLDCISGLITLADTNTIQCVGVELDTYNGNNTIYASTGSITALKYYITGTEFFEYVRLIKG